VLSLLNAELGCGVLTMNFIFACILFVFWCGFIFVVNQYHKKLKDKNEIIDGLLKINDEQKQEIYELRYLNYAKNEAEITKKQIEHSPKSINYDSTAQMIGLTQHQRNKRLAEMQNAAMQGQYGLNNSLYALFGKT
jgi:hypothetical protein